MVEHTGSGELIPDVSSISGTAQTASTLIATAPKPAAGEYLGRDMAADFSGLVQSSTQEINLNAAAVSALNAHQLTILAARDRAELDAQSERLRNNSLRDRLSTTETEREVLRERLSAEQRAAGEKQGAADKDGNLKVVIGAVFGFIPFAYEKAGAAGAVVMGVIGLALLLIARNSRTP
jgi:hypothetical protein